MLVSMLEYSIKKIYTKNYFEVIIKESSSTSTKDGIATRGNIQSRSQTENIDSIIAQDNKETEINQMAYIFADRE